MSGDTVKSGKYAVYRGKTFRASIASKESGKLYILLNNNESYIEGFTKDLLGNFIKKVALEELEQAYKLCLRVMYRGTSYRAIFDEGDKVLITTDDEELAIKLGFKYVERGVYEKWVDKNELEKIWIEKQGIWGFATPEDAIAIIKE